MEFLGGVAIVGLLWYGRQQIARGAADAGRLSWLHLRGVHALHADQASQPRQRQPAAGDRRGAIASSSCSTRTRRSTERPQARSRCAPFGAAIEFRDVSFAYDDGPGQAMLRNVSFTARAGQVIALVGLSGAGKTTLVNLLPRFYDVTGGAILIDGVGHPRRHAEVASRSRSASSPRRRCSSTTRSRTTSPTARRGRPRRRSRQAARAAHAHEFIQALPEQYETRIGERGQRLSGGQRQRLAIARALLKNSPILILDEATSSLDAESELLVQDALANLMRNRTSFVIAHRLSTVRRADAIVALERGRVAEIGRHDELLARPGGVVCQALRRSSSSINGASRRCRARGQLRARDDQVHDRLRLADAR